MPYWSYSLAVEVAVKKCVWGKTVWAYKRGVNSISRAISCLKYLPAVNIPFRWDKGSITIVPDEVKVETWLGGEYLKNSRSGG